MIQNVQTSNEMSNLSRFTAITKTYTPLNCLEDGDDQSLSITKGSSKSGAMMACSYPINNTLFSNDRNIFQELDF